MKQFLNSKSMLTPGIAGALTMLITNALMQQFELPARWVALALSFLLGTLVFSDKTATVWQRAILYVLNSLIIFSMAAGSNTAGRAASGLHRGSIQPFVNASPAPPSGFFGEWFSE